jgi:Na+/phosphate symporter
MKMKDYPISVVLYASKYYKKLPKKQEERLRELNKQIRKLDNEIQEMFK